MNKFDRLNDNEGYLSIPKLTEQYIEINKIHNTCKFLQYRQKPIEYCIDNIKELTSLKIELLLEKDGLINNIITIMKSNGNKEKNKINIDEFEEYMKNTLQNIIILYDNTINYCIHKKCDYCINTEEKITKNIYEINKNIGEIIIKKEEHHNYC